MKAVLGAWALAPVLAASLMAAEPASRKPTFVDVTGPAGIRFAHSYGGADLDNIVEGTGGGACVFDYDGDGWLDVYFPNGRWEKT